MSGIPSLARPIACAAFVVATAAFVVATVGLARADEGQWMPRQIPELDAEALRAAGLELDPKELHATDAAGREVGLLAATVNLSGCSAAFVTADGLIATNHHCAYGAIQAASSVEHDYLKDGFVAKDRAGELEAKNTTVQIVESVTDVTAKVRAVADAEADPAKRAKAVEALRKSMIAECEATGRRCRVADFYAGAEVQLIASIELEDVRLVYAPPSSVGNYGGEVDNWMWPRHTGDFSLLRAYVGADGSPAKFAAGNVPYRPARHLAVGPGVTEGDFIAVLGFPGSTQRYQSAAEVARHIDQVFPGRIDLYGEWIAIMEAAGAKDPAVRIKVAAKMKGLQNRFKNAQGMLDGLRRNGTVARRMAEVTALREWAAAHPETGGAATLDAIEGLSAERRAGFERDFLLENLMRGPGSLAVAIDVVRRARERGKPDLERTPEYMDRVADELWQTQTRRVRDWDVGVERALLGSVLRRVAGLPEGSRFLAVGEAEVDGLLRTELGELEAVKRWWDADWAAIEASRDPMIVLARGLVPVIEAHEERVRAREGVMLGVGPKYFELLRAVRTGPVYPDANGTLRFSYGEVAGYSPREGLIATPRTTVTGMMEKATGVEPFEVSEAVRAAAVGSKASRWVDAGLGDVPVAFLGNLDTTGGNSGSPVVDGQGRWVGLNFDRVWENVAGDFGYSEERSRNVMVDVRYLLWNLEEVAGAGWLLEELGVGEKRVVAAVGAARGNGAVEGEAEIGVPVQIAVEPPKEAGVQGCGCSGNRETAGAWWLVAAGFLLRRRRVGGA